MTTTTPYEKRSRATRLAPDSSFVQPDEFLRLLLSRRAVVRSDAFDGEVRGLIDLETGKRILIEHARLLGR